MQTLAVVAASLAGLAHIGIWVLESLLWKREPVWRLFGARSAEDAATQEGVFFNQGFYNLFLALGALVGAWIVDRGDSSTLLIYSTGYMVAAAIVLVWKYPKLWRGAVAQGTLPAIALIAIFVSGT